MGFLKGACRRAVSMPRVPMVLELKAPKKFHSGGTVRAGQEFCLIAMLKRDGGRRQIAHETMPLRSGGRCARVRGSGV
jgi:hypothetical protein